MTKRVGTVSADGPHLAATKYSRPLLIGIHQYDGKTEASHAFPLFFKIATMRISEALPRV